MFLFSKINTIESDPPHNTTSPQVMQTVQDFPNLSQLEWLKDIYFKTKTKLQTISFRRPQFNILLYDIPFSHGPLAKKGDVGKVSCYMLHPSRLTFQGFGMFPTQIDSIFCILCFVINL